MLPPHLILLSPSRMRTSCSPCSCLTTSSKDLDQRGRWRQGGECVCKRKSGSKREREFVNVCVRGRLLTCKLVLVCLLRAVSPEGTERPSPSSWFPSGVAPSPSLIMQNLSFTPETQREKTSSRLTGTGTPHFFYLELLLMEELRQPVMAQLRRRKLPPNLVPRSLFPFSLWWLRFGFVILILPLCMWATPPWSS